MPSRFVFARDLGQHFSIHVHRTFSALFSSHHVKTVSSSSSDGCSLTFPRTLNNTLRAGRRIAGILSRKCVRDREGGGGARRGAVQRV